ncbi:MULTISPECIES: GntR family transcriptional regulator [unclassified Cryobacterium]|uniref:GntR family transcriptional regulator n=1 Tax=unclassified Cryobacterium TaxID=2649013 RepID=UPI001447A236|nr:MULTISPECIES: GntR family transcriptional regulator [unclassified Cryobacterium]
MSEAFKTRQEEVYAKLRSDILAGRLLPGSKLRFVELCERYGSSVGVVREALSRLLEQDLVHSAPQQGFIVTPISRTRLIHLTSARVEIESLTLGHAVAEGDVDWEAELLAAHHRLASCPLVDPDDPQRLSEEWARLHAEFHRILLSGCGNPFLVEIASQLRDAAELYRRWSVPLGGHGSTRDIVGEHRAITNAALARDAEAATRALERHIALTTELLLEADFIEND